eukprot:SAG11_NODE_3354_length_2506_cov_0.999585_4_plen_88_part_01
MANRTVVVDNDTWQNMHTATVGAAMAAREEAAYYIMRNLDVSYVLVVFGGLTGTPRPAFALGSVHAGVSTLARATGMIDASVRAPRQA